MTVALVLVLSFVAVVLFVHTVGSLAFSIRDREERVSRRLSVLESGSAPDQAYSAIVRKASSGAAARAAPELYDQAATFCRHAGLTAPPERIAAITLGVAVCLWLGSLILLGAVSHGSVLANAVVSLVSSFGLTFLAVYTWISGRRARRLKQIEEQLPLALDIVTRAIRAGHPVISALQLASEEMSDPIRSEFALIVDETTYGFDFREALQNLAERTGSADARFFAVSVSIQAETGGNLTEILESLAGVIRGRQMLHRRVRSLGSEGRMSAMILSALPVLLISFLGLTQPRFYTDKFSDPIFWPTVAVVVSLYLVGWFIIHRIVNFRY